MTTPIRSDAQIPRNYVAIAFIAMTVAVIALPAPAAAARKTLYVEDGKIYTAAGEPLVLRGFNEMFVWSTGRAGRRWISEIDKTGANALRLMWDHKYPRIVELLQQINNTVAHKMVAIPECHNATGRWGEALQACVEFWNDPMLIHGIERNRKWTILNIANEAGDDTISDEDFIATYKAAITSLRQWGYTVPIMIDASQHGQNLEQLLRVGAQLLQHDPLRKVIFSVHSYWGRNHAIANYHRLARQSKALGLAIIVGEGPSVTRVGECADPNPLPYLEGMRILDEHQIGWLNWSWGGVSNEHCDNFRYFDLTREGRFGHWWHQPGENIVALSPYSVMQTSRRPRSFYNDGVVKTSGIYLHLDETELSAGDKTRFKVIVAPTNAQNKTYSLDVTGDSDSITIDEGSDQVIALQAGTATITATTESGAISWAVKVHVKP